MPLFPSCRARAPRALLGGLLLAIGATGCAGDAPTPAAGPDGDDRAIPFPIDAQAAVPEPATYKGLPLRLATQPPPNVLPVDGVIGVVCIGMSNAHQECARLLAAISTGGPWSAEVSPAVRLINCAVGGHAIERWNDPAFDAMLWDACISARLPARGVRRDQVRVILHKAANQFGIGAGGVALPHFPAASSNFAAFERNLSVFAQRVKPAFPDVQAVYTTSRSYGGYSARPDRGEPQSYEEGHALNRWHAANPQVDGVWYGWGAYIWAPDCSAGVRNGGGVCYERNDFASDAVHPSASGEIKIARLMHERLRQESWYRR